MKMTAYEFAVNTDQRVDSLSMEDFHLRPRHSKRLIEEVYPMSRLALLFQQAGLKIQIEAFESSDRADGHIWIDGFLNIEFDVQVTYAGYNESDALRARLLTQQGFAPGAGPIQKDKKTGQIVAIMAAEDIDEPLKKLAASIREVFLKKVDKAYSPETVLLIAFDAIKLRGRGWWSILYAAIEAEGGFEAGIFSRVYLFNWSSNEIHQVA